MVLEGVGPLVRVQLYVPSAGLDQLGGRADVSKLKINDGGGEAVGGEGGGAAGSAKDCDPEEPSWSVMLWPNPCQYAPFQPSPQESVMTRLHELPPATIAVALYGAPPVKLLPSLQDNVHWTSLG